MSLPDTLLGTGLAASFTGRRVLEGVTLEVRRGEVHVVLGPSGAGKTTLLRILNLLAVPDAGEVRVGGDEVALRRAHGPLSEPQERARRSMVLVLQKPVVFRASVLDNALFGLRLEGLDEEAASARARAALGRLGLAGLATASARRLSGGEQQRLAFARAIVLERPFLLLDECTANLDPRNVKILEEAIAAQARASKAGVLLVTHDVFQARRLADRVTLLVDGRVVESASKASFFEAPEDPRTRAFVAGELAA